MANQHIIKNTSHEVVLKCYCTESSGQTIDISLSSLSINGNETYVANVSSAVIKAIYWGAKKDKQIDITRVIDSETGNTHGHYYLINSGSYQFQGFVDNVYSTKDLRIITDGPAHVTLVLGKNGYTANTPYIGSN